MKIAIIGTGISGLSAAWLLNQKHDITVFEKQKRLGGHSHTVCVDYDGVSQYVDTGFIVYNELNYPNLTALFRYLGVATEASDMSFSFSQRDQAMEWSGDSVNTIFTYRRNIIRPHFLKMLAEILRFNKVAGKDLDAGRLMDLSLGDYLKRRDFHQSFRDQYLLPMGSAIWSTSMKDILSYPAQSFIQFFANHRLLHAAHQRPQWRTVTGGSQEYVKRLSQSFANKIRIGIDIGSVDRSNGGVTMTFVDGSLETFDHVVFACHSDEALALLNDASEDEKEILGAIRYSANRAILHCDPDFMPKRKRAWASWNYISDSTSKSSQQPASVTYWMNRLQNIDQSRPLFLSLNPRHEPDPTRIYQSFDYAHPLYDLAALYAQEQLQHLQGVRNTWFCGAYFGHGFHEDGLESGINVAAQFGISPPWQAGTRRSHERNLLAAAE